MSSRAGHVYGVDLPVVGIATRIESNDKRVVEIAEATWGGWRAARVVAPRSSPSVTVRITVESGSEHAAEHAPVTYETLDRETMRLSTVGSRGHASVATREASALVTAELVEDRDHFRHVILEALVLFIISRLDRAPFHAAALCRESATVLLSGPTGVGKSTLALTGMRRGFGVLAEDMVWVQQTPRPRVWGLARWIHVPEDTSPDLLASPHATSVLLANGRRKLAVPVSAHARPASPVADRVGVCLLTRGGGPAHLDTVGMDRLERLLLASLHPGFDVFPDAVRAVARYFGQRGAWRLRLGSDPEEAVPLIAEMLTAVAAR